MALAPPSQIKNHGYATVVPNNNNMLTCDNKIKTLTNVRINLPFNKFVEKYHKLCSNVKSFLKNIFNF